MVLLFESVVLGVLQGITEWLPISSKSQGTIAAIRLFGMDPQSAFAFAVFLHIGTMIAATVYFRHEIKKILTEEPQKRNFLILALIGTAITGLPLYFLTKSLFVSAFVLTAVIGVMLIASGILQKVSRPANPCNECKWHNGLALGLAQGLAIIPGVSRTGVTTSSLLLMSFSAEEAFRMSFLLSIPTVFFTEILFGLTDPVVVDLNAIVGVVVAGIVGYASLGVLLRLAKRVSFADFAIAFGVLYVALAFLG
jgi:undecaprenyl-diphosphatase